MDEKVSEALASLTEIYSDSEGEEYPGSEERLAKGKSRLRSPPPPMSAKALACALVASPKPQEDKTVDSVEVSKVVDNTQPLNDSLDEDGLPPEPDGECPKELVNRVIRLSETMRRTGLGIDNIIEKRKDFRNPSIYEKLIQFCEINEHGTNYPPETYDPFKWGNASHYDKLAKAQMTEIAEREKHRQVKTKFEVLAGTKRPASADEEVPRKRTKWDQVRTVKASPFVPYTTSATRTKSSGLSAFASFNEKKHRK